MFPRQALNQLKGLDTDTLTSQWPGLDGHPELPGPKESVVPTLISCSGRASAVAPAAWGAAPSQPFSSPQPAGPPHPGAAGATQGPGGSHRAFCPALASRRGHGRRRMSAVTLKRREPPAVQWWRAPVRTRGTCAHPLVREDPACCGAAKPAGPSC